MVEHWEIPTAMTTNYCKECEANDSVKAYMDVVSEWSDGNGGWVRTIKCKRCKREVKLNVKISIFFSMALDYDGPEYDEDEYDYDEDEYFQEGEHDD
jgi:uncharacterized metal-binding protein YceD (DUF177 family)